MKNRRNSGARLLVILMVLLCSVVLIHPDALAKRNRGDNQELTLSANEMKKLTQREVHELNKADDVYAKGKFKRAATEYNVFIELYPRSIALPYALLKRARSLEKQGRVNQAITEYQQVLDYFPDHIRYAAAAIYYQGNAHFKIGEPDKAMVVWSKMARDKGYSQEPFAADALNKLAEYMVMKKREAQAMKYYRQVAVNFRSKNREASNDAISKFIQYYLVKQPNVDEIGKLYQETRGFDSRRDVNVAKDLKTDQVYWNTVRRLVQERGRFKDMKSDQSKNYYRYWADTLSGKFLKDDRYQIDIAWFRFIADGDTAAWVKRLDEQFNAGSNKENANRIILFMGAFKGQSGKVKEYYQKLKFGQMTNAEINRALRVLADELRETEIALDIANRFHWDKMSDKDILQLGSFLSKFKNDNTMESLYARMRNPDAGKFALLNYYNGTRNIDKGVPLAQEMLGAPDYAGRSAYILGQLYQRGGKFKEAIAAYRQADNQPENLIRIAECFASMKQINAAVGQYKEIENFFKDKAPWASMRIALLYQKNKRKPEYISQLRHIVRSYKKTNEASEAHERLEKEGYSIGGGADE